MEAFNLEGKFRPQVSKSLEIGLSYALDKPRDSFSSQMGNSFRQTIASTFSDERMDSDLMLKGHIESTIERIKSAKGDYVLVSQDTCLYTYTTHGAMKGLGKIQKGVKGIIQHNVFAMSSDDIPLGFLNQEYWSRESEKSYDGKESKKWMNGLSAGNKLFEETEKRIILLQDREADILDFFIKERASKVELIVRICQNRDISLIELGETVKLKDCYDYLVEYGEKTITIKRDGKELTVRLKLQAAKVKILSGKAKGSKKYSTEDLSLVIATEIEAQDKKGQIVPPPKDGPLQWVLLSSLPIDNLEDVQRIVEFYAKRWIVERVHFTLKSGAFDVEKLQFDDLETTINALAFYSIAAWRLMHIGYYVRENPNIEPTVCFSNLEVNAIRTVTKKEIKTLGEMIQETAKIVGFVKTTKQPFPGIKILAKALEALSYISQTYEITKPLQD